MTLPALDRRSAFPEYLDTLRLDEKTAADYFGFMEFTNRFGGGHAIMRKGLELAAAGWPPGKTMEILDAGCGAGDTCRATLSWSRKQGLSIRYTGLDREPAVIALCRHKVRDDRARFMVGDLRGDLPEADIVVAAMVLHHLPEAQLLPVITHLARASRRCLVISELERSRRAYILCWLASRLTANRYARDDALLSIRKGFTLAELAALTRSAGLESMADTNGMGRLIAVAFHSKKDRRCRR